MIRVHTTIQILKNRKFPGVWGKYFKTKFQFPISPYDRQIIFSLAQKIILSPTKSLTHPLCFTIPYIQCYFKKVRLLLYCPVHHRGICFNISSQLNYPEKIPGMALLLSSFLLIFFQYFHNFMHIINAPIILVIK